MCSEAGLGCCRRSVTAASPTGGDSSCPIAGAGSLSGFTFERAPVPTTVPSERERKQIAVRSAVTFSVYHVAAVRLLSSL